MEKERSKKQNVARHKIKKAVTREKSGHKRKNAGTRQKKQAQENAEKRSNWKLLIDKIDHNANLRKMQAQERKCRHTRMQRRRAFEND